MKKILPIILILLVAGGAGAYFFVFSASAEAPTVRVEYSPGDFFTTNVSGGSSRLLKASIILVVSENGLESRLEAANARIRDTIIFILRDLNEEQILEPGTQEKLREDIITALNENELIGIDKFIEVLFNDFIMG